MLTMLGVAVGNELGGLDSLPITDSSFWTISVIDSKFLLVRAGQLLLGNIY